MERPGTKKKKSGPTQSSNKVKKRRFKPLKRDELKAKKEETKKRVMTRAKGATKTITTDIPNNNNKNHVHVGELEVVAIEAPEDIINEIYGDSDAEEIEKKSVEKVEKPEWFDKERKLSVSLASIGLDLAAYNMLLCSCFFLLIHFFLYFPFLVQEKEKYDQLNCQLSRFH